MARIKANLRKSEGAVAPTEEYGRNDQTGVKVGELALDFEKFEARVSDEVIDLTLREFEVLKFLANQPRTSNY